MVSDQWPQNSTIISIIVARHKWLNGERRGEPMSETINAGKCEYLIDEETWWLF